MAQPLTFTPVDEPVTFTPVPEGPPSVGRRVSDFLAALHQKTGTAIDYVNRLGGLISPEMAQYGNTGIIPPGSVNTVPRNLTEAGAQTAQLLVPGSAGPVGRVLAQTAGGEIGSRLEGNQPWEGAVRAGVPAVAGEILGGVTSKLAASAPESKGFIANQDALNYGREVNRQTQGVIPAPTGGGFVNPKGPSLVNPRSARLASPSEQIQETASGPGQKLIGANKESAVRSIEQLIPGGAPVSVPSLGPNPIPLREANDQLSEIGVRAFSRNPLDRTINGVDQRRLYGRVENEIVAGLKAQNPDAVPIWERAQDIYKSGLALIRPLQSGRAFNLSPQGPGDTQFNTPAVQQYVQNPRPKAELRTKLGREDYDALLNVLTRGAGGGRDVLTSGQGHAFDALRQLARGQNTGFWSLPSALLGRTATPNFGSQYVGRTPFDLPPAVQQAIDLILQRKAQDLSGAP